MASKGKKIALLDAGGMLSKEALLGYVFNELQPSARAEVEKLLAENEMYRDMVEGLKHVPTRAEAEHILNELNVDVAERSGSAANVPGLGESVGDFFWNYRRVAAVVGTVLIASAALFTFAIMQVSGDKEMAQNEPAQEEQAAKPQSPEVKEEESTGLSPQEPQQPEAMKAANSIPDTVTITGATQPYTHLWDNATPSAPTGTGTVTTSPSTTGFSNMATTSNQVQLPNLQTPAFPGAGVIGENSNRERENDLDLSAAGSYKYAPPEDGDGVKNEDLAVLQSVSTKKSKESKERDKALTDDEKAAANKKQPARAEETAQEGKLAEMQVDLKTLDNTTSTQPGYMSDVPRTTTEQMPVFPGGQEALIKYLHDNLRYPEKSKAEGVQGKVYLSFVIGTGGRVKQIAVIQGVNKEINAEAIRLLANMPKWEPGKEKGQPVAVMLYQTVEFKLP